MSRRHAQLHFWGKTDRLTENAPLIGNFHPLAYHLLDVAACADAILGANPARLRFLSDLCGIEFDRLRRTLVCLIALHDIGKCARGFQGKVPEFWPSALGPRPDHIKFIPVRHDAAGLWLFMNEPRPKALGERLIPGVLAADRNTLFQSVFGHHSEPLERAFPRNVAAIANSAAQIGPAAQVAAARPSARSSIHRQSRRRTPSSRPCPSPWRDLRPSLIGSARTAIGSCSRRLGTTHN
ncbi:CRISPR-associated endonuclease Cas3'' [Methylocapsa palsarum]|uniref:CRISPR-associated endonuclease Cas3'' n=1 Tax=Methylocapsa palsarum TaxID=1612308 RepID=UPI000AD8C644|nr:CRISPR-associated endonuclease Cas3'' [Methylocapsa palsarum]